MQAIDSRLSAKLANMACFCAVLIVTIHVGTWNCPATEGGALAQRIVGYFNCFAVQFFFFGAGRFLRMKGGRG